ncbi:hypothetical protein A4G28_20380 [Mycobacterium ostraviense]|uniref:Uncharacterized protein n=1 Tax=Mycobacterium ostraviense TaxID=2738409 RepID=A0A163ZL36_9MYCO|nr:hypothetical protein A4G28_20380 [Mycobacterium ostraviense]
MNRITIMLIMVGHVAQLPARRATRRVRRRGKVVLAASVVISVLAAVAACGNGPSPKNSRSSASITTATTVPATTQTTSAADRLKDMIPAALECKVDSAGTQINQHRLPGRCAKAGLQAPVVYWLFPDAGTLASGFNKPPRADLNESLVACPGKGPSPQDWQAPQIRSEATNCHAWSARG